MNTSWKISPKALDYFQLVDDSHMLIIKDLLYPREDISPFLVHLAKEGTPEGGLTAANALKEVLHSQRFVLGFAYLSSSSLTNSRGLPEFEDIK